MQSPDFSDKKVFLLIILLWIIWTALQVWVIVEIGFTLPVALADSITSNVLLMGMGLAVRNILRYYKPEREKFFYIFIWNFCIAVLWIWVVKWVLSALITDASYRIFLTKSLPVRFLVAFLITGWMALIHWLLFTFRDKRESEKRQADTDKLAKDAELYKLRQQLHPHFLFNSLNSINSLIGSRPQEARRMVEQLAEFLRGNLKSDEKIQVHLQEELHYLQLYLDIEKVRFGHRLHTEIKTTETCLKAYIPQMLLQPLVENAIKFGLYDTTEAVSITLDASVENNHLIICIKNPFDPQAIKTKQGTGFGLNSVQRRLYLLFARRDLLQTQTNGDMFSTTVIIPQQHD